MINVIFYDLPRVHADLLPMTFTRPVADFRIGITTIREKWAMMLPQDCRYGYRTVGFLVKKYKAEEIDDNLFIAGNVVPNPALVEEVLRLEIGEALFKGDDFIAYRGVSPDMHADNYMKKEYNGECLVLHYLFDIFLNNGAVIKQDFEMITKGRTSCALSASNTVIGDPGLVFVEEGAYVEGAFLNTNGGPIYIGKDAQVMEGSCVRGPMALCEHSNINMGSKIYSDTTIGPWSKV
ncbi:MAG: glucose-1-phosphate thymidylyltransferase, partial [Muribaculaceae bacterium]|nr:glucose-1-phosphate thymidylyltransferase [Muribaculaceae bacterium]